MIIVELRSYVEQNTLPYLKCFLLSRSFLFHLLISCSSGSYTRHKNNYNYPLPRHSVLYNPNFSISNPTLDSILYPPYLSPTTLVLPATRPSHLSILSPPAPHHNALRTADSIPQSSCFTLHYTIPYSTGFKNVKSRTLFFVK